MNPVPAAIRQSELPSLNLARGTMATLVFFSHAAMFTGAVEELRPVFRLGGVAVEIFIFMSGFLMLWHYKDREKTEPWDKPVTWRTFWVRRLFRVAPLYWLILTLLYFFHNPFEQLLAQVHTAFPLPWSGDELNPERIDRSLSPGNIASHYTFAFGLIPAWASNNALPDWSITLEMQYYLVFPFLVLSGMKAGKAGWILLAAGSIGCWILFSRFIGIGITEPSRTWGWYPMPTLLPFRIHVFVAGMLAALGMFRLRNNCGRPLGYLAIAAIMGIYHDKLLGAFVVAFIAWEWMSRHSPASSTTVIKSLRRSLESRIVTVFADCSYGVYLMHILMQLGVMALLLRCSGYSEMPPSLRWILLVSLALPATFAVAFACHRWVEMPGISLGKRVLSRWKKTATAKCEPKIS